MSGLPRFECGVCWWVYDPAEGDAVGQVAAGTRFEELPVEWCCPTCDGPRGKFLRMSDEG
jgi:rubredoxin